MILADDLPYLRWALMKLLASEGGGYWVGDGTLMRALDKVGFGPSLDQTRSAIGWLATQGLVEMKTTGETRQAMLLQPGLDIVEGRNIMPGVKHPLHLDLE
ncbi:MAG: ArsR family transcriptional regulator [Rhizobiales bacterium]|nr:ArsR family transcriptional regulator [Hyphomicrobiales bacterium]